MHHLSALEETVRDSTLASSLHSCAGAAIGLIRENAVHVIPVGAGVDASTLVQIGSLTKIFTGLLLAQAVQRSELSLDSRLDETLFQQTWPGTTPITTCTLATHTSGLPRISAFSPENPLDPYRSYTRADLLAYLDRERPHRPENPAYAYSNLGYAVLGLMLERATRQTYADLLQERLLAPLGLVQTGLSLTGAQSTVQPGYCPGAVPPFASRPSIWHHDAYAPCGGIDATLDDLMVALRAFLDASNAIAAALEFSLEPRAVIPGGSIGLAWHLPAGGHYAWHNGATFGHSAFLALARGSNAGIAIVSNQAKGVAGRLTQLGHELMRQLIATS